MPSKKTSQRCYAKITLDQRIQLINKVLRDQISTTLAASSLGIKLSTAKLILKKFREDGELFETRKDRRARLTLTAGSNPNYTNIVNSGIPENAPLATPDQLIAAQNYVFINPFGYITYPNLWNCPENPYYSMPHFQNMPPPS